MMNQKRIRDYGITIGILDAGQRNAITDVPGVKIGNVTIKDNKTQTGVTAILPHTGNIFKEKVVASSHVINGFGKTIGTIQLEELGYIETPIILTNTLSVGTAADALIYYMLEQNEEIGLSTGTVNPIVGECNDMFLNDIRGQHVTKEHVLEAIKNASSDFEEGAVGAGRGMSCYHLKGGIGSASRTVNLQDEKFTVGALVLSNFGRGKDLIIDGKKVGEMIDEYEKSSEEPDKGSIMIILATDMPLTERQLKRLSKRAVIGLNRTGSYIGNGSGDVVISFSTANRINHEENEVTTEWQVLNENYMDYAFRAVGEAVEEAVLNSMITAETVVGRDGNKRVSLKEYAEFFAVDGE
jgi:D-aminopeptidase